jgi:hypothetical protein
MSGSAALSTEIRMEAAGTLALHGAAALRTGRFAGQLQICGEPLTTARQDWILNGQGNPEEVK